MLLFIIATTVNSTSYAPYIPITQVDVSPGTCMLFQRAINKKGLVLQNAPYYTPVLSKSELYGNPILPCFTHEKITYLVAKLV